MQREHHAVDLMYTSDSGDYARRYTWNKRRLSSLAKSNLQTTPSTTNGKNQTSNIIPTTGPSKLALTKDVANIESEDKASFRFEKTGTGKWQDRRRNSLVVVTSHSKPQFSMLAAIDHHRTTTTTPSLNDNSRHSDIAARTIEHQSNSVDSRIAVPTSIASTMDAVSTGSLNCKSPTLSIRKVVELEEKIMRTVCPPPSSPVSNRRISGEFVPSRSPLQSKPRRRPMSLLQSCSYSPDVTLETIANVEHGNNNAPAPAPVIAKSNSLMRKSSIRGSKRYSYNPPRSGQGLMEQPSISTSPTTTTTTTKYSNRFSFSHPSSSSNHHHHHHHSGGDAHFSNHSPSSPISTKHNWARDLRATPSSPGSLTELFVMGARNSYYNYQDSLSTTDRDYIMPSPKSSSSSSLSLSASNCANLDRPIERTRSASDVNSTPMTSTIKPFASFGRVEHTNRRFSSLSYTASTEVFHDAARDYGCSSVINNYSPITPTTPSQTSLLSDFSNSSASPRSVHRAKLINANAESIAPTSLFYDSDDHEDDDMLFDIGAERDMINLRRSMNSSAFDSGVIALPMQKTRLRHLKVNVYLPSIVHSNDDATTSSITQAVYINLEEKSE
ncbi:hypothetical protein BDF22DRAFT_679091 [Syncephalis plumigaleata]|nr:hypothetical protein BDF22DRAFT_679091 [Syncephalis plumigaleata]